MRVNLKMLLLAVKQLERPKRNGDITQIRVDKFLDYMNFELEPVPEDPNFVDNTREVQVVRFIAVEYFKDGRSMHLEWELDL